jgi:cell fate regulator YaaT (PSP1 superfamily)
MSSMSSTTAEIVLVRYGAIPEVARFAVAASEPLERGCPVVVRTHRGIEIGTLLERLQAAATPRVNGSPADGPDHNGSADAAHAVAEGDSDFVVLRPATPADLAQAAELRSECEGQFETWRGRIREWNLNLELIDLEWTLDRGRLVLYVLNDRGPDCTKLALQAAAAGLGTIEVQPVGPDGLMQPEPARGGCRSGG